MRRKLFFMAGSQEIYDNQIAPWETDRRDFRDLMFRIRKEPECEGTSVLGEYPNTRMTSRRAVVGELYVWWCPVDDDRLYVWLLPMEPERGTP